MVSTSQIGVKPTLASIHNTVSTGQVPAPSRSLDIQAIVSSFPTVGDQSTGPIAWISMLWGTSFWEAALIAILFLLISGLIVIRVAESLSNRDVELTTHQLLSQTADEPVERDRSPTREHRSYEQYLSPDTPTELLSDKGEVVRLLVSNHGRIRQHRIAEETGWSKSKVSRICSQMHADGTIEKTSVGRENVITLSDRMPDAATPPGDAENPLQ